MEHLWHVGLNGTAQSSTPIRQTKIMWNQKKKKKLAEALRLGPIVVRSAVRQCTEYAGSLTRRLPTELTHVDYSISRYSSYQAILV